jgi:hypothetical protein
MHCHLKVGWHSCDRREISWLIHHKLVFEAVQLQTHELVSDFDRQTNIQYKNPVGGNPSFYVLENAAIGFVQGHNVGEEMVKFVIKFLPHLIHGIVSKVWTEADHAP